MNLIAKKNIQSYFLYLCIIVSICIFKSEIWSFIKNVLKELFLTFVESVNYIGKIIYFWYRIKLG